MWCIYRANTKIWVQPRLKEIASLTKSLYLLSVEYVKAKLKADLQYCLVICGGTYTYI